MRAAAVASLVAVLAACGIAPLPTGSPSPNAIPSAAARTPSPTTATSVPSPAPVVDVVLSPEIPIVYTESDATLWASAFIAGGKTGPSGPMAIASTTVDFGDGAVGSVSQDCASPSLRLQLQHRYRTAGSYTLKVNSARLCDESWQVELDTGEGIRALAAASPLTADWPACTTYQLMMTDGGTGAGLGNVVTLIRLTNVSNSGCYLIGYPGLQLVSATHSLLPTHVHQATQGDYSFPAMAVGRVALGPGDVGAFLVGYTDNPSASAASEPYDVACPPATWLRVILPQTHQWGTADLLTAPCEGSVNVSPIFPGRDRIEFP
jgi:uncharacterized protein DUF4232